MVSYLRTSEGSVRRNAENWRSQYFLTQRWHWYAVPGLTTGSFCSRPCLVDACMHAEAQYAPWKLLLSFIVYLLPSDNQQLTID
eukprot:1151141-Pelagomonas_calceolata.AAC.3